MTSVFKPHDYQLDITGNVKERERADVKSCCLPTKDLYGYCKGHRAMMFWKPTYRVRAPRGA